MSRMASASRCSPINLIYCFIGVFIGTLVGVLPGIGPISAMSLLLPITLSGTPESGIIMMAGIYYGSMYGGSTTSILVNIPGEAAPSSPASTATRWPSRAAPDLRSASPHSARSSPAPSRWSR
jgi:TctA family transporter